MDRPKGFQLLLSCIPPVQPSDNQPHSPLLALPAELRLKIYEYIVQDPVIRIRRTESQQRTVRNVFALAEICRLVRREAYPLLPSIQDKTIQLKGFWRGHGKHLHRWLRSLPQDQMNRIRRLWLEGRGICHTWDPTGTTDCYYHGLDCCREDIRCAPACTRWLLLDFTSNGLKRSGQNDLSRDLIDWEKTICCSKHINCCIRSVSPFLRAYSNTWPLLDGRPRFAPNYIISIWTTLRIDCHQYLLSRTQLHRLYCIHPMTDNIRETWY